MDDDRHYWFAPKRYGYGAGLPIAWQGWALLGGLLVPTLILTAAAHLLEPRAGAVAATVSVAATLVYAALMIPIARRHTRGGWRWRWGEDA